MTNWQLLGLAAAASLFAVASGVPAAAAPTTFLLTQTGTAKLEQLPSIWSDGASSRLDSNQLSSRSYALTYDQLDAEDSLSGNYGFSAQSKLSGGGRLPYIIGSKGKDGYKKYSDMNVDESARGSIIGYDRRHDGRYHLSSDSDTGNGYRRNYGLGSSMYGGFRGSMRDMMFMNPNSGYNHMKGIRMNPMLSYPMGQSFRGLRFGGQGGFHSMGNHMNYPAGGGYPIPYRRPLLEPGIGPGYPGMGMFGNAGMMPGHQGMNYGLRAGANRYSLGGLLPGGYGHYGGFMMKKRSSSNEIEVEK